MIEEWRDIAGFEGLFQISSFGRVKSLGRLSIHYNQFGIRCEQPVKEKILSQTTNLRYPTVCLSVGGKARAYAVHRLVLETFVGPCPPGMLCRHFPDRDTRNNRLDNLRWGTAEENAADKKLHGTASGWKQSAETCAKRSKSIIEWHKRRRASAAN